MLLPEISRATAETAALAAEPRHTVLVSALRIKRIDFELDLD